MLQFCARLTKDERIVIKDRGKASAGVAMGATSRENNINCVELVIQYTVTVGFQSGTTHSST